MSNTIEEQMDRLSSRVSVTVAYTDQVLALDYLPSDDRALVFIEDTPDAVFRTDELDPAVHTGWRFNMPDGASFDVRAIECRDGYGFLPDWVEGATDWRLHFTVDPDGAQFLVPRGTAVRPNLAPASDVDLTALAAPAGHRRLAIFRAAVGWLSEGRSPFGLEFWEALELSTVDVDNLRADWVEAGRLSLSMVDAMTLQDGHPTG